MRSLIMFLVRMKLGVKNYEVFTFANQKSNCVYYFCGDVLLRRDNRTGYTRDCHASLNYLVSDECVIERLGND